MRVDLLAEVSRQEEIFQISGVLKLLISEHRLRRTPSVRLLEFNTARFGRPTVASSTRVIPPAAHRTPGFTETNKRSMSQFQ
jgi:hypothetical protein